MTKIIPLVSKYTTAAAKLHRQVFRGRLLTHFNQSSLTDIYRLLLTIPDVYLFGCLKKDKLIGILVCSLNTSQLFKNLIVKIVTRPNFLLRLIFQIIIQPQILAQTISLILYPFKPLSQKTMPELLVIAVNPQHRRHNLGTQLINKLERQLRAGGIKQYKVIVELNNLVAQKFYYKIGFKKNIKINQINREWLVLIKELK